MGSPSLTMYASAKLLNHMLRNETFTPPSSCWVALYTGTPGDTGANTNEVAGNGYARQCITFSESLSGVGTTANNTEIVFPTATGAGWGTITYVGICNAVSSGLLLLYGALSANKTIAGDDQFRIASSALTVVFD